MNLSILSGVIGDSPTLKLNAKAAELKKKGEPIVHLGGGEPIELAPKGSVEAMLAKVQSGKIKYSPATGLPELKSAVCEYTKEQYGKEITNANVIITGGAKQAIYNFLLCAVNPGDEVIFPAPYWVSYPEMVRLVGGTPVVVKPAQGIKVSLEEIKAAITPKTKAIMFNSPNNPSGILFEAEFIKNLVELCEEKNIWLMTDDIYHQLVFGGKKAPSPYAYAKNPDNIVTINGVSKLFGLTGLRIGWAVSTNTEMIKAMGRMQAQTTSCTSDLSQVGALAALQKDKDFIKNLQKTLETNRDILLKELSQIPNIKANVSDGTFYCLVDFSYYNKSSLDMSAFLLDKVLVATMPSAPFGVDGYLRISYCAGKENIVEGIKRIKWALDKNATGELKIGNKIIKKEW